MREGLCWNGQKKIDKIPAFGERYRGRAVRWSKSGYFLL